MEIAIAIISLIGSIVGFITAVISINKKNDNSNTASLYNNSGIIDNSKNTNVINVTNKYTVQQQVQPTSSTSDTCDGFSLIVIAAVVALAVLFVAKFIGTYIIIINTLINVFLIFITKYSFSRNNSITQTGARKYLSTCFISAILPFVFYALNLFGYHFSEFSEELFVNSPNVIKSLLDMSNEFCIFIFAILGVFCCITATFYNIISLIKTRKNPMILESAFKTIVIVLLTAVFCLIILPIFFHYYFLAV